jgi:hypothetical protein
VIETVCARQIAIPNLGFDPDAVTRAERSVLHQAATLLLQVEIAQEQLVAGAVIDADVCIRLSSEARRILTGLRSRGASQATEAPPWSPLRSAHAKATSEPV